jgi:hypothetical protein
VNPDGFDSRSLLFAAVYNDLGGKNAIVVRCCIDLVGIELIRVWIAIGSERAVEEVVARIYMVIPFRNEILHPQMQIGSRRNRRNW